jgi:hypothetical protein
MHRSSRLAASTSVAALLSVCSIGVMAQEAVAADATITLNGSSATASGSGVTVNGNTVTITAGGSYQLSGTLNGQVIVDTAESNTVSLILSGANITSSTTAAINIAMAGSVTVELAAGTTNSLNGGTSGDNEANAALFSAEDMVITGTGSLNVRSNAADGIASKDTLTIESGTITVNAGDDGIRGKDFLLVKGGTLDVTATTDGLKSNNDSDASLGYTTISGGTITVNAGDDAIKGVTAANVSGGTIRVTRAFEGIEALKVNISGGNTSIVSTDDGINAVEEGIDEFAASTIASVTVSGGTTVVDAGVDGVDSNGGLTVTGGVLVASCATSMGGGEGGIDTNGPTDFRGGTVLGAGITSMAVMSVPPTNGQGWVAARLNSAQNAGTVVHVVQNNQVLASWRSMKRFQEIVFSGNRITNGQTYQIYTGGSIGTDLGGGLSTTGGNISGASQVTTATAGQYSGGLIGMGFGGFPGGTTPGGGWPAMGAQAA